MITTLEVYDSFRPERLLEVKFILNEGNSRFYDLANRTYGISYTSKSFRASYKSLRDLIIKEYEQNLDYQI